MGMIFRCLRCRRHTTQIEAELRVFNTGRCGCGGELVTADGR